jgi:CRP-like cAMP-binding protein
MTIYATWDGSLTCMRPWLDAGDLGERIVVSAGSTISEEQVVHGFFYLIRSGYVRATMTRANGVALLLEIFGPGTLFGVGSAFEAGPRFATTCAVTDCALDRFDAAAVAAAFGSRPALALALIGLMSATQRSLARKLMHLTSSTPQERVLELLARVSRVERLQHAQKGHGGQPVVHLTHDQLAAMTGLSRVTVTRTLKKLAAEGLVSTRPKHVEVLRPDVLEQRAAAL